MKKLILAAAVGLITVSCAKKEETGSITTQETTVENPSTTSETTVVPVDSATAVQQTTSTTTANHTTATTTMTGEVYRYISDDGKTTFSVIYDTDKGLAAVKNETNGKTYAMKNVVSGSGAKFEDADGNFFWTHQGEFDFGKGDKTQITGKDAN